MTSPLGARSALVTGASRGIGAEVARVLALAGARVVLVSRNASELDALAMDIGHGAISAACDLTDESQLSRMAKSVIDALGDAPDIVVNNAGIFTLASIDETSSAAFSESLRLNLVAPFMLVRAFLPAMRARGSGHFVTLGSIADRAVFPGNVAYAPAKHGVRALHEMLRMELGGSGVRATLISPGPVDTPLWDRHLGGPNATALPRREDMLAPSAVAAAVLYAVTQPPSVNVDELRLSHS